MRLASGMTVSCLQKHDVHLVDREVQGYFSHGVRLEPGDTVFDVGANIGLFTLAAYDRCLRDLHVYAFEPIEAIFDVLHANLARHDVGRQLRALPFGLSSTSGTVSFAYYPLAPVLSTAYPDERADLAVMTRAVLDNIMHLREAPAALRGLRWLPRIVRHAVVHCALKRTLVARRTTGRVQTLSQVVRDHGVGTIDLLKIDAERAELEILRGIEPPDWPLIRQVVVEVHDVDDRVSHVRTMLSERGFTGIAIHQPPTLTGANIYNLFATRGA